MLTDGEDVLQTKEMNFRLDPKCFVFNGFVLAQLTFLEAVHKLFQEANQTTQKYGNILACLCHIITKIKPHI